MINVRKILGQIEPTMHCERPPQHRYTDEGSACYGFRAAALQSIELGSSIRRLHQSDENCGESLLLGQASATAALQLDSE